MGYITIDNISVKVTSISFDPQLQRPTRPIIGGNGSKTSYLGSGGNTLTLECRAKRNEIKKLKTLYKKGDKVTLISPSQAEYNGNYHITGYTSNEHKPGRFTASIKLIEDFTYNVTRQDFVNYQITAKTISGQIKIGEKWNPS